MADLYRIGWLIRIVLSEWLLGIALDLSTGEEKMHLAVALKYYFSKVQVDDLSGS